LEARNSNGGQAALVRLLSACLRTSNGRALAGEPQGSPVSVCAGLPTLLCARPPHLEVGKAGCSLQTEAAYVLHTRSLWASPLILDTFYSEPFVMLPVAAVFAASIGQDSQQWNALLLVPRHHLVVEHVRCRDGVLAVIQLGKRHLAIAIDVGLLVNTTHAFDIAHLIGILTAQVARVLSFDLAVCWLFFPGFFQRA